MLPKSANFSEVSDVGKWLSDTATSGRSSVTINTKPNTYIEVTYKDFLELSFNLRHVL